MVAQSVSSASLLMTRNWEWWLTGWRLWSHPNWRNGVEGNPWIFTGPVPGEEHCTSEYTGVNPSVQHLIREKDLAITQVEHEPAACPCHKTSMVSFLHCIRWQSITTCWRGDPSLLLSTGKTSSGGLCPVLGSSDGKSMDITEKSPAKGCKDDGRTAASPMSKDSELGLHSLVKRRFRGILLMYTNTCRESTKKTEQVSFFRCPVAGAEEVGTNWNTGGFLCASGNTFILMVSEHCAGYPER